MTILTVEVNPQGQVTWTTALTPAQLNLLCDQLKQRVLQQLAEPPPSLVAIPPGLRLPPNGNGH